MIAGTYNAQIKASCSLSLPWIFLIHNFSIFLLPLVLPARESQLVLHVLLHSGLTLISDVLFLSFFMVPSSVHV